MADDPSEIRMREFRERPLHWVVVHHLLDAGLLRELAAAIVERCSGGTLRLSDLFEEDLPAGRQDTADWSVAAREVEGEFAYFLARFITTIIWRGDDAPHPPQGLAKAETGWVHALNAAFELSWSDLDTMSSEEVGVDLDSGIGSLAAALAAARDTLGSGSTVFFGLVDAASVGAPSLLSSLLTKHVGDLFADVDRWDLSIACYRRAENRLSDELGWTSATAATRQIVAQSIAMATWHREGPEAAAGMLETLVAGADLATSPLPVLNATFDLMNASMARGSFSTAWNNRRSATLQAPLLLNSHHLDNALTYASAGRFRDAHRWFWATLRRQTALGGTVQSSVTKGHYGRSIINEVEAVLGRDRRPEGFAMGVRLLVESGRTELAEATEWSDRLVEAYVDAAALDRMRAIAVRSPGMAIERSLVATTLQRQWLLVLPRESEGVARDMLSDLVARARDGAHTGMSSTNTGGLALKALKDIGLERPEFRGLVGDNLVTLFDVMVRGRGPVPVSETMETLAQFIDGVDEATARELCVRTIGLVGELPPNAFWPVTQAASRILGSDAASRLGRANETFQRDRSIALVKLALNSTSEHVSLLYLLRDVDPTVVHSQLDADGLDAIVGGIRERARDNTSSAATANIHALLVAPKVSGMAGVEDAMEGLESILRSAEKDRPSPSLQNAYEVLLLLARTGDRIGEESGRPAEFRQRARELLAPLVGVWRVAAKRPLIFAAFSLPPRSSPDRVIVHNWAFASLEFAWWLDATGDVERAIDVASADGPLLEGVSVARAVQGVVAPVLDAGKVAAERADAFYAALGERLASMGDRQDPEAAANLRVLLNRSMELGPRGEDAALLASARGMGVWLEAEAAPVVAYTAKLRRDPRLRLSLSPLLRAALAQEAGAS